MNAEFSKLQEESFLKSKMENLMQENEEMKILTECLARRIRMLSEYNSTGIDNIIASKVEKENCNFYFIKILKTYSKIYNYFYTDFLLINLFIQIVDCICGGKNFAVAFYNENTQKNMLHEVIEKDPALEGMNLEKSEKTPNDELGVKQNNNSSTMEIESTEKEEKVCGNAHAQIQIELLEKQNNDLIKEKASLKKEIENLNLFKVLKNTKFFTIKQRTQIKTLIFLCF